MAYQDNPSGLKSEAKLVTKEQLDNSLVTADLTKLELHTFSMLEHTEYFRLLSNRDKMKMVRAEVRKEARAQLKLLEQEDKFQKLWAATTDADGKEAVTGMLYSKGCGLD